MRWLVFGCKYDFVVCFYSLFLFCIYIAEEHTRHASMCFTVAVECVLPFINTCNATDTHTQTRKHTQTHKRRQQGHVAHNKNTLDGRPQSNLFLLFLLSSLSNSFAPANVSSRFSTSQLSLDLIYL